MANPRSQMTLIETPPTCITRSEINENTFGHIPYKEFNHWLLWVGIAPESQMTVSHIGIYTDFT